MNEEVIGESSFLQSLKQLSVCPFFFAPLFLPLQGQWSFFFVSCQLNVPQAVPKRDPILPLEGLFNSKVLSVEKLMERRKYRDVGDRSPETAPTRD